MREIKFRAWRKDEMYDGLGIEKLLIMAAKVGFEDNAISPVIWMQYTGLKDKNGVEIYEGDIVNHWKQGNRVVTYPMSETYAGFGVVSKDGMKNVLSNSVDLYEVIGNIHENPDLL